MVVVAAVMVRWALLPILGDEAVAITVMPAVLFAALLGGLGPGLLATFLGAILIELMVIPREFSIVAGSEIEMVRIGSFCLVGVVVSWLGERAWRAQKTLTGQQEILRESEARFREMADTAPAMLWITEPDGHCSFLSRGWYEFTGQTEATGLGYGWANAIHPNDREMARRTFAAASEQHKPYRVEYRARRADGEFRWVLSAGSPRFDDDGAFCGIIGSVIDIHERRRAEERMRMLAAVVENCTEFIGTCDLEMQPTFLNEAGRRMVGLDSMEEVKRIKMIDCFWPEDRALIEREALPVLRAGHSWAGEVRFRNFKTGQPIDTIWNAFVLRDSQGLPTAWAAVCPNLTAIKAAEAAACRAMEIAEAANRAKDNFLAMLSHELRTPLNPVLMLSADQAKNEELPAGIREDFALISQNVELEVRLIDDLLDLTRITRGKMELHKERCDLHALLTATLEILRVDFEGKNLSVTTNLAAAKHEMLGDPVRLQQVFWNILRNALRFTPQGGAITVQTKDINERCMSVSITDNGRGIEPQELVKIFTPFEQGNSGQQYGGLGLGLAISKSLVDAHGGRIHASSGGRGRGATFTVELPAHEPASVSTEPANLTPESAPPRQMLRILLVDDHEATRRTLARLLRRRGHIVATADDLAGARKIAAGEHFDLFISDLELPDGNGCDLMREFAATGGPPGIALSGYGMEHDIERSLAAGFRAHLIKPVDMEALDRVLREWPASTVNGPVLENSASGR